MDIKNLALKKDTFPLTINHPVTGEPLVDDNGKAVVINLYGTASKQHRDAVRALQSRALKRGKKTPTPAEIAEEGVQLLVAVSDSADNLEVEGVKIGTPGSFRDLYENAEYSWLREQVDVAVGEISNFLEK